MTAAPTGLAARAVMAARRARDADPGGFPGRHYDWHTWQRRARLARTLASVLDVPAEQVSVIDDAQRVYGAVPGDPLIITDAGTGREWRFVPGHLGTTETFLLLDECPARGVTVPLTRIATLADFGAYLDTEDPGHDPHPGMPRRIPRRPRPSPRLRPRPPGQLAPSAALTRGGTPRATGPREAHLRLGSRRAPGQPAPGPMTPGRHASRSADG